MLRDCTPAPLQLTVILGIDGNAQHATATARRGMRPSVLLAVVAQPVYPLHRAGLKRSRSRERVDIDRQSVASCNNKNNDKVVVRPRATAPPPAAVRGPVGGYFFARFRFTSHHNPAVWVWVGSTRQELVHRAQSPRLSPSRPLSQLPVLICTNYHF